MVFPQKTDRLSLRHGRRCFCGSRVVHKSFRPDRESIPGIRKAVNHGAVSHNPSVGCCRPGKSELPRDRVSPRSAHAIRHSSGRIAQSCRPASEGFPGPISSQPKTDCPSRRLESTALYCLHKGKVASEKMLLANASCTLGRSPNSSIRRPIRGCNAASLPLSWLSSNGSVLAANAAASSVLA